MVRDDVLGGAATRTELAVPCWLARRIDYNNGGVGGGQVIDDASDGLEMMTGAARIWGYKIQQGVKNKGKCKEARRRQNKVCLIMLNQISEDKD